MKYDDSEPKQWPSTDEEPDTFYGRWRADLDRIARRHAHRFRTGWCDEHTEARSAIDLVFWNAYLHWKPSRGPFGIYFWSLWCNHCASQGRYTNAQRRSMSISLRDDIGGALDEVSSEELPPLLTYTEDELERKVIGMLASGYRPTEVIQCVGRRPYYRIINAWKVNYIKERWS